MQGHTGVAFRYRMDEQGLWKAGSLVNKRMRCPLVPMGACDWFVEVILLVGRELKPAEAGITPGPCDEECCLTRGPHSDEHNGKGELAVRLSETPLVFPRCQGTHNIRTYSTVYP